MRYFPQFIKYCYKDDVKLITNYEIKNNILYINIDKDINVLTYEEMTPMRLMMDLNLPYDYLIIKYNDMLFEYKRNGKKYKLKLSFI